MCEQWWLHLSVGVVDTIEWACVLCGHCIRNVIASRATNLHQILCSAWTFLHGNYSDDSEGCSYGQLVTGSFIMTWLLMHQVLCRDFWQNIKSPRWLSLLTAQIWSQNHLWKGRDFRPSVRFRKIGQGSWRQLGELCEVLRCLLWRGLRCHYPMYNVSCILHLLQ